MHAYAHYLIVVAIALSGVFFTAIPPYPLQAASVQNPCCEPVTSAGDRLASTLDGMHVESLWLANEHVNWETGEPDRGGGYEGPGNHTHCSAFAAAAAKRLGVYLLRPPEHGQELLSNAQARWLESAEGRQDGWRSVANMQEAQTLANRGDLVLVSYPNPNPHEPPGTSQSFVLRRNPSPPCRKMVRR